MNNRTNHFKIQVVETTREDDKIDCIRWIFQYWINFPIFKMSDPMFIFNLNKMGGNLDSNRGGKVILNEEDEAN